MPEPNYKLRIKHPSGAEFEAEGSPDFICSEKHFFLAGIGSLPGPGTAPARAGGSGSPASAVWGRLAEIRDGSVYLKIKFPRINAGEAALLIMAAAEQLTGNAIYSALNLSRALKRSGHTGFGRIDRLLGSSVRNGDMAAFGTKRNRSYQLTGKGLQKAASLAAQIEIHLP